MPTCAESALPHLPRALHIDHEDQIVARVEHPLVSRAPVP